MEQIWAGQTIKKGGKTNSKTRQDTGGVNIKIKQETLECMNIKEPKSKTNQNHNNRTNKPKAVDKTVLTYNKKKKSNVVWYSARP